MFDRYNDAIISKICPHRNEQSMMKSPVLWIALLSSCSMGGTTATPLKKPIPSTAQGSSSLQDGLLLRGIFQKSTKIALLQVADTTLRHPHWWIWFPETMATLQKKAEKSGREAWALSLQDGQVILAFFQKHPPRTLRGWRAYASLASKNPRAWKICQEAASEFFSKASLSEFKDLYPGILKIFPKLPWPLQRLVLAGTQKPLSDARSMLEILRPKEGRLKLLQRLLAKKPDAQVFSDYQALRNHRDWDPLLAVAMIQCCIRTNQGAAAFGERFRNLPASYVAQHPKEILQLDMRIMRQLLQEGQGLESEGKAAEAKKLYERAVSIPLVAHLDKAHDAQWIKGFIYFVGLKNYTKALQHFTQASSVFSPSLLDPKNILKAGPSLAQGAKNGLGRHDVRALFWLGLCCEYMKKPALAQAYYGHAAPYGTYFYGQLACWKLNRRVSLNFAHPNPGKNSWHSPAQREAMNIISLWKKMAPTSGNMPAYDTTLAFCKDLVVLARTPGDHAMALQLIKKLHPTHVVECAKGMAQNSSHVFKALYPILPQVRRGDPALVHGIILTESCFHPTVISWDGGIGMMQIMAETAKKAAKDMKIPLNMSRLIKDTAYQLTFGTHILGDYIKQMGSLYPPGIAAYNAGVNRAGPWVARTPNLKTPEDALVWIESIPFSITHHYVLRVMESYIIYRHLMGKPLQRRDWHQLLRAHP